MDPQEQIEKEAIDHLSGIKEELLRLSEMIKMLENRLLDGEGNTQTPCNINNDIKE